MKYESILRLLYRGLKLGLAEYGAVSHNITCMSPCSMISLTSQQGVFPPRGVPNEANKLTAKYYELSVLCVV